MKASHINISLLLPLFFLLSCGQKPEKIYMPVFRYDHFKDSVKAQNHQSPYDTTNIFDKGSFVPSLDTPVKLLADIDTILLRLRKDSLLSPAERASIAENIRMLDSFYRGSGITDSFVCREKGCGIFAEVIKSKQLLYLYIDGELKDSFPVSTGKKGHTTPNMNTHPSGPLFMKYTSRKFPGGNYEGLGNMPYAVFVRGGYAIHGTTPGNFNKLGSVASHGCIRIHPDNAKVFYELVKLYGLSNTWVRVIDSL